MIETKVGKRYAKSLLSLSQERNVSEAVANDMKFLLTICQTNRDFTLLLSSPIIHSDKKLAILTKTFSGRVHSLTLEFFDIITRKGREFYLPQIAEEFIRLYKEHKGIQTAIVTSAVGLDDHLRQEVYKIIRDSLKSEIELVEKVDKNLIGGLILRVGDKQYDASIASALRKVRQSLVDGKISKN
jgi:F-type H+-transporting ATPase subunit delta